MSKAEAGERAPFGFKLLVGAAALYLLVRFVQMGAWLIDWLR